MLVKAAAAVILAGALVLGVRLALTPGSESTPGRQQPIIIGEASVAESDVSASTRPERERRLGRSPDAAAGADDDDRPFEVVTPPPRQYGDDGSDDRDDDHDDHDEDDDGDDDGDDDEDDDRDEADD